MFNSTYFSLSRNPRFKRRSDDVDCRCRPGELTWIQLSLKRPEALFIGMENRRKSCKFTDHLEGGNVAVPLTPVASIVLSFSPQFVAIDWEGVGVERVLPSLFFLAFPDSVF